ncbi:ATP-binding protein [Halodesulfovibrio spirochaetisodalis]|uniref:ATP-binding protein n=1 Tax=Halodesulfovibrio spirochaetisodalis TaxID=1560234 RepID=UPI00082B2928|nr:transporter substrate-binding domain-containing protein [Halodesulfovibrio spirochaetisodalis]
MRVRSLIVLGIILLLIGLHFTYQKVLEHLNDTEAAVERIIENKEFVWANYTEKERAWLSKNNTVNVGVDKNFFPIEGLDNEGQYIGVASDYLRILEKLTGLSFTISVAGDWSNVLAAVKSGKLDMLAALAPSPNRSEYLAFTESYIDMPGIIVVQRGSGEDLTLADLKGKTVAVVKRYVWHDHLEEFFTGINLDIVKDSQEGLQHVSFGQADAMVDFQFSITHKIKQSGILNLQVGGEVDLKSGITMGVRKDRLILRGILNKALKHITAEEKNAIAGKWLKVVESSSMSDSAIAVMVAFTLSLVVATCFTLLWNISLKRIVEQQTCKLNRELTKRDNVEAALRKSEERYRRIFENIQDVYFQAKLDGSIKEVSPSVKRVFGCTPEEAQQLSVADFIEPSVLENMWSELRKKGELEDYAFVFKSSKEKIYCSVTGKYLRNSLGEPIEFVGSVRNVTTRVQYEEMLSKANLELESRVEERTRDLQTMNEALQRSKEEADAATRAKSQFLTSISHELRTPLHAIIAFTEHVRSLESSSLVRKYLRNILDSSFTLLDIINDLLDFSKIEAGHVVLERVPFMLDHCVQRVCNLVLARAAAQDLEFIVDLPPTVPAKLIGDSGKLQQIILNIASNALKFTPSGGTVTLSFDYHIKGEQEIWLQCFVHDTGIGIPEDSLDQLFVPFQQLSGSDLYSYGGTGLGLSICKRFVESMGGGISVESEEGKGTLFAFSVPLLLQKDAMERPSVPEALSNLTALLVTKSERSGTAMRRHFDYVSVNTEIAYGVEAAITRLKSDAPKPDVICIGHNIAASEHPERLFNSEYDEDIPVLMLAAKNDKLSLSERSLPERVHLFTEILTHRMLQHALCTIFGAEPLIPLEASTPYAERTGNCVFKGVKILAAEDTQTNRDILQLLLNPTGAEIVFVTNGLDAVEAVRHNSFDVILMDVQMPQMNGCEAAMAIRKELGVADVPIIALTAHAVKGSRERMLEAGMEFFLTKPFGKDSLYSAINTALGTLGLAENYCLLAECSSLVLPSSIDSEVANRLGLPQDEYDVLLKQFAKEHECTVSSMQSLGDEQDYLQLEAEAHAFTGAASNIGAGECAALAKQIELHAGRLTDGIGNVTDINDLLVTLNRELQLLVEEIHTMIPDKDSRDGHKLVAQSIDAHDDVLIMELANALELTNPLRIEELLPQAESLLSYDDFAELEALVMDYEYEKAHSYLLQCWQTAVNG